MARLFIYQSSIVSQILDFFHRMVTIFSFDHMTGENMLELFMLDRFDINPILSCRFSRDSAF